MATQAKSFELCIEVLMLLTIIFNSDKQYPSLSSILERFKNMTETLINAVSFNLLRV